MSEFKGKILVGAVLAVIIAVGLAGAVMLAAPQHNQQSQLLSGKSVLLVQLTDPPIVPPGTTSLNMSYSDITILVSEPVTSTTVSSSVTSSGSSSTTIFSTITQTQSGVRTSPQSKSTGQSGTVDLLKLQNVSKTLASVNLQNGSTIYSVTFAVKNINITINGVTSPVALATGSNSLLVTLARPATLEGTNAMLVDLTPTIINTTSGYQMIPSSVGIMKTNVGEQEQHIGHEQALSNQDDQAIHQAMGQVSANLVSLSVTANVTTLEVNVTNIGSANVSLAAIGIHGNFTAQNNACTTTSTSGTNNIGGEYPTRDYQSQCGWDFGTQQVVFYQNSTLSQPNTQSGCETGTMSPNFQMGDNNQGDNNNHAILQPGQCVVLTFKGVITAGDHGIIVVPSTLSGQQYIVDVIAGNSAPVTLNCTLTATSPSCTTVQNDFHNGGD